MAFSTKTFAAISFVNKEHIIKEGSCVFKENSELRRLQNDLANNLNLEIDDDSTEEEVIFSLIDKLGEIYEEEEIEKDLFNMAGTISQEILQAFSTISGPIAEEVESLTEEVNAEMERYLKSTGSEALISDQVQPEVEFGILRWGDIKNDVYKNNIINRAVAVSGVGGTEARKNALPTMSTKVTQKKITPVTLHKDITSDIVEKLNNIVVAEDYSTLEECWNMIVIPGYFDQYRTQVAKYLSDSNDIKKAALVKETTFSIRNFLRGYDNLRFSFSEDTIKTLNNNKQQLMDICDMAEYGLIITREQFKNTLVLSPSLLNEDGLTSFKSAGGTIADIAYHLRINYHINNPLVDEEMKFPFMGIGSEVILNQRSSINSAIARDNANIQASSKVLKNKAMRTAYRYVLTGYFNQIPETRLPEGVSKEWFVSQKKGYIEHSINGFDVNSDNIEDSLYKFIMGLWYEGTFVNIVYGYLGKEAKKLMQTKEGEGVSDQEITELNTRVVAILVTDYIKRVHIE